MSRLSRVFSAWLFLSLVIVLVGCAVKRVESVGVSNLDPNSVNGGKAVLYGMIIVPKSIGRVLSLRLEKTNDENDSFFIRFNDSTEVPNSGENYLTGVFTIALPEGKYRYFTASSGGGYIARWSLPYPAEYLDVKPGRIYYFGTFQCMQIINTCYWYHLKSFRSEVDAHAKHRNPNIDWQSAESLNFGNPSFIEEIRNNLTKKN